MSKQAGNRNGTQVIQPKQQRKPREKPEKTEEKQEQTMPTKGGVRIGGSKEEPDQWRCKTCHRPNPMSADECQICQDPKSLSVPPKKES